MSGSGSDVEVKVMVLKLGGMDNPANDVMSGDTMNKLLSDFRNDGWRIVFEAPLGFEPGLINLHYRMERGGALVTQIVPSVEDAVSQGKRLLAEVK